MSDYIDTDGDEYTREELEAVFDERLDEIYPEVEIAGATFSPSRILAEVDPIAYRCGFNDWVDAEGYAEL